MYSIYDNGVDRGYKPKLPMELDEIRKQYDLAWTNLPAEVFNVMCGFHLIENLLEKTKDRELSAEELRQLNDSMRALIAVAPHLMSENKHTR